MASFSFFFSILPVEHSLILFDTTAVCEVLQDATFFLMDQFRLVFTTYHFHTKEYNILSFVHLEKG